ncbi:alpha/beta fold hydrolase [Thalassotalea sp. 1_MG-2023]|uniref:alpha/beta fold hydrolase n=1 Tax=Thalassotalea sp. 1_MG-2023 TaxID=3062680 RepID=UPI0026E34327|nr:alpha/beta fold hydrolase [Thalassotalea sp. 1_MG-2023]
MFLGTSLVVNGYTYKLKKEKGMIKIAGFFIFILATVFNAYGKQQIKPSIATSFQVEKVNLYIECYGQGSPAIIINAGLGGTVEKDGWRELIKSLHLKNTLCVYDRANLGKSGKSIGHYDVGTIVEHQNLLLQKAGVKPPFVMVGHSYGAYPIKLFNHLYPEKVAAILLVDPSLYGQFKSHINKWDPVNDKYNAETRNQMEKELASWNGTPNNIENINNRTSSILIENSSDFGDKPYVLLWARDAIWQPPKKIPDGWHPAVWERIKKSYVLDLENMQTLSKNIKITFAKTPEHYIHKFEPEAVINEINYLLNKLEE